MNIYPEDLEPAYRAHIQKTRDLVPASYAGLKLALAGILPGMICGVIIGGSIGFYFLGGAIGFTLGSLCGSFISRDARKIRAGSKVTEAEITLIGKEEADTLKLAHLGLIFKLILMRPSQDMTVEQSIRSAIRDIGSGIARLPGQPADDLLLDAETFKKEASCLAAEADRESDPVVAASLQRQSAARKQRAEAISWNSALARRNQILRQEMTEHIQALKTMLDATALGNSSEGCDLAALAEIIQQVASETKSLTDAKKELDFALEEVPDNSKSAAIELLAENGIRV